MESVFYHDHIRTCQRSSEAPLPADSRRSTWQAWCSRFAYVWQGMWMQGLRHPTKFGKTFVLWNYWVKYYCWASKTNWWPRFAPTNSCHSCRTTEDPKGLKTNNKSPVPLRRYKSVVCFTSARLSLVLWVIRCGVCDWQGKCRVSMFHRNPGLDNKLVTGLPAPDVHQVLTDTRDMRAACVFIYGDIWSISWVLMSWLIWIKLKGRLFGKYKEVLHTKMIKPYI